MVAYVGLYDGHNGRNDGHNDLYDHVSIGLTAMPQHMQTCLALLLKLVVLMSFSFFDPLLFDLKSG